MFFRWFATTILVILATGGSLFSQNYQLQYPIGPGDLLRMDVLDLDELDGEFRINALGSLTLPLLGSISAKNVTLEDLKSDIVKRLEKDFLNNPQVILEILEYNHRPISVIGSVLNPGRLPSMDLDLDLIEALTLAGGTLKTAGDTVLVRRRSTNGVPENLEVSLSSLMSARFSHLNIPIFPGDTIMVPEDKPIVVSVLGEVNKPGEYEFSTRNGDVTILRVIAIAGDLTDYARPSRLIVKRMGSDGKSKEHKIDLKAIQTGRNSDFVINDRDVVIVN